MIIFYILQELTLIVLIKNEYAMSSLIIEKAKLKSLKDLIYLLFEDEFRKERENLSDISMNK